ncbi:hypothetical protein N7447_004853 [Penicillium robsamsonii]|uniref:uncharacterized protein n=1 Tax=Penicillium robsamsonii TaxID=1792511 RepID=UPI002547DF8E|nr:uncharacterized protein N7447_004853 [Penicillium robsamsonii]KAJ5822513.1 hypothetical protein N7447_004853 [Penicillium robsamsonii]
MAWIKEVSSHCVRETPFLNQIPIGPKDGDKETRLKRCKSEVGPANPSGGASKDAPKLKNGVFLSTAPGIARPLMARQCTA